jgi:hypothetical protein
MRARKDWEQGHHVRALIDGVVGVSEAGLAKSVIKGVIKGQVKLKGPYVWRTKPWEEGRGLRQWMGDKGILKPGQHGHHALIPKNGWGKAVPDWLKNQPWNIKGMESAAQHGRIHGRYKGAAQFNPLERYWYGTPQWWKAANALGASGSASAADPTKDGK